MAIKRLARAIAAGRGRLVFVPTHDVAALAAGTRDTPDDGVDLDRAIPGDAGGSNGARLALLVLDQLFPAADVVVDAQSGGETMRFPTLVSFHHARDTARRREMETAARGFGTRSTMINHDTAAVPQASTAERVGMITIGPAFGWGASLEVVTGVARPVPWSA
jgi:predicted deacylase